ncbi:hypothetical protein FM106_11745 [Brachybacterium faecium]|nr:hypothetical protein FM106_11745 [Brachybacterium faecium]
MVQLHFSKSWYFLSASSMIDALFSPLFKNLNAAPSGALF